MCSNVFSFMITCNPPEADKGVITSLLGRLWIFGLIPRYSAARYFIIVSCPLMVVGFPWVLLSVSLYCFLSDFFARHNRPARLESERVAGGQQSTDII